MNINRLGLGGWIALTLPFGLIFGLLLFPDNIALGIAIVMPIGIAIGVSMEEENKKKRKNDDPS